MSPFTTELCITSDYLHDAKNIYAVVAGAKGKGWHPQIRGVVDEDDRRNVEVGVAYYEIDYELKSEATRRASEMLRHVKALRKLPVVP